MSRVLHIDTVLDQHLELHSLILVGRGILLRNSWVWGAVDSTSVLEPLPLLQIISFLGDVLRESLPSSMIRHWPFSDHAVSTVPPLVSIPSHEPNIVPVP